MDPKPGPSRSKGGGKLSPGAASLTKIVKREPTVSALPFTSQQMSMISNSLVTKWEKTDSLATGKLSCETTA